MYKIFSLTLVLFLCLGTINAQDLFQKNTKEGLLRVMEENRDDNKKIEHLLLINDMGIDTIESTIRNIQGVFLEDSIYYVLTSPGLYVQKYLLKEGKWTKCLCNRAQLISAHSYSYHIEKTFFFDDEYQYLFTQLSNNDTRKKEAYILKKVDMIYHQIYFSDVFLPFQTNSIRDSLFNIYVDDIRQKAHTDDYDIITYLKDTTLFSNYLDKPSKRSDLISRHVNNLILEETLNKQGYTFLNDRENIYTDVEIYTNLESVYVRLVYNDIEGALKTRDEMMILKDSYPSIKIADFDEGTSISWSFIHPNILRLTLGDSSPTLYFINDRGIMPLQKTEPIAFHRPLAIYGKSHFDKCPWYK